MRRRVFAAVLLAAVGIGTFLCAVPQRYFNFDSGKQLKVHSVLYREPGGQEETLTEKVDLGGLESTLFLMETNRYKTSFSPFAVDSVRYEIDGTYGEDAFHILIGDSNVNFLYESAQQGGYGIRSSAVWMDILTRLRLGS